ncbi:hypothetical protein [Shinella sp. G-2]|uniref:hypothetical protein n=1 Tax=Shinella sp. G-2 TaxID=3133141 RepID=UPI003CFD6E56
MRKLLLPAFLCVGLIAPVAIAAGKDMKEAELKSLLGGGKEIQLGGEGLGYKGTLSLTAEGTAVGSAQPDSGDKIDIKGKWRIKGNKFCRTWEGLDKGKEVCETWRSIAPNKVEVYVGKEMTGVNSW